MTMTRKRFKDLELSLEGVAFTNAVSSACVRATLAGVTEREIAEELIRIARECAGPEALAGALARGDKVIIARLTKELKKAQSALRLANDIIMDGLDADGWAERGKNEKFNTLFKQITGKDGAA